MRHEKAKAGGEAGNRRTQRIHEERAGKLPDLADCPDCGACFREGRWTWRKAPVGSAQHVCPACLRIATQDPAGEVHVEGGFVAEHRSEIEGLLRNIEERERNEHPLKRIMAIEDEPSGFVVTVTDAKLAQTFGRALEKAYAGRLEHSPTSREQPQYARVRWARET